MPYYPDKNILFIHIPKTGGSIIEDEILKHTTQTLFSFFAVGQHDNALPLGNDILPPPFNKISLQHQYYSTLYKYREKLNINFDNIKVFCCIRNPYDRVISDLFFLKLIKKDSSHETIKKALLNKYLYSDNLDTDGHQHPQYKYITDENEKIIPNIKIFKCEELNNCNDELCEFLDLKVNVVQENVNKDYSKYLNKEIISIINEFYRKDFEIFGFLYRRGIHGLLDQAAL